MIVLVNSIMGMLGYGTQTNKTAIHEYMTDLGKSTILPHC